MTPKALGFVFARGGSKGIPRKNLVHLAGKPLIAYSIESALKSIYIDKVIVSTDDYEIAAVAREFGAETPFMRPKELATDNSPEWLSWQHAVSMTTQTTDYSLFVSIPTTSPLRDSTDIDRCVEMLVTERCDAVITVTEADRSPYFNMVEIDDTGRAQVALRSGSGLSRRQDAPTLWNMTTVAYATTTEFILNSSGLFEGRVHAVTIPKERALDIDTPWDLHLARLILANPYPD